MSDKCFSAGCKAESMEGSVLCQKHYDELPAPMRGESDTPKTDAELRCRVDGMGEAHEVVDAEFARDLERQNAELVEAALKVTRSEHSNVGAMVMVRDSDMDELRAVLAKAGAK